VAGGVEAGDLVDMLGIDEAKANEILERARGLEGKKPEPAPVAAAPAEEIPAETTA
jgi:endonuclease V-like protein UPF0215 family